MLGQYLCPSVQVKMTVCLSLAERIALQKRWETHIGSNPIVVSNEYLDVVQLIERTVWVGEVAGLSPAIQTDYKTG